MTDNYTGQAQPTDLPTQKEAMRTKAHGQCSVIIGWILLALSVMVVTNVVVQPHTRDSSIEALMTHPDSHALAGTIGFLIGINALQLAAILLGIHAALRKNPRGRALLIASIVILLVNTFLQFLPNSAAQSDSHQSSSVSNTEIDPHRMASDIARELKGISTDDVVKDFVETLDKTPIGYVSERDGFSATFPSHPTSTEITGDTQTTRNYQAYSDDELVSYNIFFNILEKKVLSSEAIDAYLKATLTGRFIPANWPQVIREELVVYKGFRASRFAYREHHSSGSIRHEGVEFLLDGDAVSITIVHPDSVIPTYSFEQFVASFNLMPVAPQLKEAPWEDRASGLRMQAPADMDISKTRNPRTGLIVMFGNAAGHSLGIFDVSLLNPNMTAVDVERELSSYEKYLDGWYRKQLSSPSTGTEMAQLVKILKHDSKFYMVQGYGPAQTLFRSELKFRKAVNSLTFLE